MSVSERHLESRNSGPSAGQWTQDTLFPKLDSFGGRQRVDYKYWLFSALKCASKSMRWDYAKWVAESDCLSCVWGEFWEWEWRLDAALGWPARSQTQRRHRLGGSLMAEKAPQVTKEGKDIEAWKGLWTWGAGWMASWSLPMGTHERCQTRLRCVDQKII